MFTTPWPDVDPKVKFGYALDGVVLVPKLRLGNE
jgi:hypothetical protein